MILLLILISVILIILYIVNRINKNKETIYNLGDILNIPLKTDIYNKNWNPTKCKHCRSNKRFQEYIDKYPNTILEKYYNLTLKKNLNIKNRPNFEVLKDVLSTYENPLLKYNTDNILIVHIRAGDKGKVESDYINKIIELIKSIKPDYVILLGNFHNSINYKHNPNLLSEGKKDIEDILKTMQKHCSNVLHLKHNDADTDLVIMYNAPHLLVHKGGYSALGAFVCKGNVYYSNQYLHLKETLKYRNTKHL